MMRGLGLNDRLPKPLYWFGDQVHTMDAALWVGVVEAIRRTSRGWIYTIKITEGGWAEAVQLTIERPEEKLAAYVIKDQAA